MKRNFFLLAGLISFLCACDNSHDDMYDAEWVREQYENQWKMNFGDIDPNQNFNMATQVKANLTIVEDALSEYTFKIYTANPLYNDDALLMAKTTVTTDAEGYAETSIAFDALVGQENYYVVRMDDHNRRLLKSIKVNNGSIDASFGVVKTQTRSRAMETGALPTLDAPYTVAQVNQFIAEGYDLNNGIEYTNYGKPDYGIINHMQQIACPNNNTTGSLIGVVKPGFTSSLGLECTSYLKVKSQYGQYDDRYESVSITEQGTLKLVITNGAVYRISGQIKNVDVIVASGGTLELNGIYMADNARIIVMHGGNVVDRKEGANEWNYGIDHNAKSALIYNAGTCSIGWIGLNFATFYNAPDGVMYVDGIKFTTSESVLTNWGKIEVNRITGNGGKQGTLNNGCLLRSQEKIEIIYLNQDGNTALECEHIKANCITLRENSILRAKHLEVGDGTAEFYYVGKSESSALVSAQKITSPAGAVKVDGAIYFEANEFNSDWVAGLFDGAVADAYGVTTVGESNFAIFPVYKGDEIAESDCTGKGNIPNNYGPPEDDKAQTWRLACEDLGSVGDYDFNDIVFDVTYVAGDDTAYVKPVAAGGTLRTHVCNRVAKNMILGEIHELFGFDDITLMINTGVAYDWNGRNGFEGKTIKMKVPTNYSVSENMGGFYLLIENGNNTIYDVQIEPKESGNIPQMICVPSDWRWPTETINIGTAYPEFGLWGQNYGNGTWYNTVETEYVY